MNVFDKLCAAFAFALGICFLIVGILGLFIGSAAYFRLPPVIGCLPAFAGWGIVRAIYVAWSAKRPDAVENPGENANSPPPI
jgi:hypothetical protein